MQGGDVETGTGDPPSGDLPSGAPPAGMPHSRRMARIFISHSSLDNDLAIALHGWLHAEGWDDVFLDIHTEDGLLAGERWERELLAAAGRCEAVLCLVTGNWLGSGWCLREYYLGNKLNKRLFMMLAGGLNVTDLPEELKAEWQLVDLSPGEASTLLPVPHAGAGAPAALPFSTAGLTRLRNGLKRAGLDPAVFAWPPQSDPLRSPYRGLRALDIEDAGIFFGREAQVVAGLDRLRGLREGAPPRFLAILGASGAGKSSFLRAGLLSRLARDDTRFFPLPILRPEHRIISGETGLIRALESALEQTGRPMRRDEIAAIVDGPRAGVVELFARLAREAPRAADLDDKAGPGPVVVLAIDQGEELFLAEGATEAKLFLEILRTLLRTSDLPLMVIAAIRSDSYERLQSAAELEGVRQETLSLPPMPRGSYKTLIEGPAERFTKSGRRLQIEPALTQALLADIEDGGGKDALPLLAFTIALLYAQYGQDGLLSLADYEALGRIRGSIEVAVEQALGAADEDPRIPRDREARLGLLRRGFIPWLAGVDLATNTIRRRVARMSEVPDEARPLVALLIEARLLSSDVTATGEVTVEPAHEALLRQWGTLKGWLEEAFGALTTLEGVKRAARDWEANNRAPDWLAHKAGRLEDAEHSRLLDDRKALRTSGDGRLAAFLTGPERDYLNACRVAEDEERNRELEATRARAAAKAREARRTRYWLIAVSVLFVAAAVLAVVAWLMRGEAERQTQEAQASLAVVRSNVAKAEGAIPRAAAQALYGYRKLANVETRSALLDAGLAIDPHLEFVIPRGADGPAVTAMVWLGPDELLLATKEGRRTGLQRLSFAAGRPVAAAPGWQVPRVMFDSEDEATIVALSAGPDGSVIAARNSGDVEVYRPDASVARWRPPLRGEPYAYVDAAIGAGGRRIVFRGPEEARVVACAPPSARGGEVFCEAGEAIGGAATAVAADAAGTEVALALADGGLMVGDAPETMRRHAPKEPDLRIRALALAPGRIAAIVESASGTPGAGGGLALLGLSGDGYGITARGPVNVGRERVLLWRTADEVVHGCLGDDPAAAPLCTVQLAELSGTAAWTSPVRLAGHAAAADQMAVAPEGVRLASRDTDGVKVWRWPADRTVSAVLALPPAGGWASLDPRPDGTTLLLSGRDGTALDLSPRRDPAGQRALPVVEGGVIAAVAVPGGRVIARDARLDFLPDGSSAPAASLDLPSSVLPQGGLVWTGQGRSIAVSLESQQVGLVDFAATAPKLREVPPPKGRFQPFGITVDRKRERLIVSSKDGVVHLFELGGLTHLGTLANSHVADVSTLLGAEGLAVSPDGRYLATTAAGPMAVLYDLERGASAALLRANREETKSVAFDHAGRMLAVMDAASMISVWRLDDDDVPAHWLDIRLEPSRPDLPQTLPAVYFTLDSRLAVLTHSSEVISLFLDPSSWIKRLENLGYDKLPQH